MIRESDWNFLKRIPLFRNLEKNQLEVLYDCFESSIHARGTAIFLEGDETTGLYIIRKGLIEIYRSDPRPEKGDLLLCKLPVGQIFGEFGLIHEGKRLTTAIVGENAHLFHLVREDFETLSEEHPDLGLKLMKELTLRSISPFLKYPDLFVKALAKL